jgi:pRiA4b ORF-3-like protein
MAKAARRTDSIVSLKATLRDVRPPIWRRLLVPAGMTLDDLHHAIQAAMGREDAHLHAFDIAGREYGDPREVDGAADEARLTVGGMLRSGVSRFSYTYDFGDNWEHSIVIEGERPPVDGQAYPQYRSPRVPRPWKAIREDFVSQGSSKARPTKVNRIKS